MLEYGVNTSSPNGAATDLDGIFKFENLLGKFDSFGVNDVSSKSSGREVKILTIFGTRLLITIAIAK